MTFDSISVKWSYNSISWGEVWQMGRNGQGIAREINQIKLDSMDINSLNQVSRKAKQIHRIFENLNTFHDHSSLGERLWDFLTLKTFKVYVLAKSAPSILQAISNLSSRILGKVNAIQEKEQQDKLAREQEEQKRAELARQLEEKRQAELKKQEEERQTEIQRQKRLEIEASIKGHQDPARQIEFKRNLVSSCLSYLKTNPATRSEESKAIDAQVSTFLEEIQTKLQKGENSALPSWYHATNRLESVQGIIEKGFINSSYRLACASSREETDYGPFSIAFDHHNTWKNGETIFYRTNGLYANERLSTLWIHAGPKPISVSEENVAFLVTSQLRLDQMQETINKIGKNIKVVSREFSDRLRFVFDQVEACEIEPENKYHQKYKMQRNPIRMIPKHWIPTWSGWEDGLKERSKILQVQ